MELTVEKVTKEQLKKDDEIIIATQSGLRYYKLLRDPKPMKNQKPRSYWPAGFVKYSRVKCSTKMDLIMKGVPPRHWTVKKYELTPNDHNAEVYVNLDPYFEPEILKVIRK